jgi:flagellar motor switch/type III secretory pathway protein FliN
MNSSAATARSVENIPKLDSARMDVTNALLKLLSRDLNTCVAHHFPEMRAFTTNDGFAFALLSASGVCMLGDDHSVDHACSVLDAGDAMLRAVEERLETRIEPVAIYPQTKSLFACDEAIILNVAGGDLTLLLAVNPDADQRAAWIEAAEFVRPDHSRIPVALSVEFEAAKLPVADAAAIEGGDMLLLPRKALATWQAAGDHPLGHGVIDLIAMAVRMSATYEQKERGMTDDDATDPATAFQVPVTIRLPTQYINAADYAGLRAGGSLQLGPLVHGLPVELLVGGRRIGTGEIVEIGENFAVLIDERDAPKVATETTGEVDLRSPASREE